MSENRLSRAQLAGLPASVEQPQYDLETTGHGIVHIGVGGFHRAHQAAYTETALNKFGGDWRIIGISLRSPTMGAALNPQDGLYTLLVEVETELSAHIIGAIQKVICASDTPKDALDALSDPATKIVTLTITEKAYLLDRTTGGIDLSDPQIVADLENPENPTSAIGYLVAALNARRKAGIPAFTMLSCDNLPENGKLLQTAVLDFAQRVDGELADWIASNATFPSSMVDRITPAPSDETKHRASELTGLLDEGVIETEPFSQWVIEDQFAQGRPQWDQVGVLMVDEVAPYEKMKLRMLNGAHSFLAYAGFLSGKTFVRETMQDLALRALIKRHMDAAKATLPPLPGIDLNDYRDELLARFTNPAIKHQTWQISSDGTQKLPQRIFEPAMETISSGGDIAPFAFAFACWLAFSKGCHENGESFVPNDPLADEMAAIHARTNNASELINQLMALPGFCPEELRDNQIWRDASLDKLALIEELGMQGAIEREAQG